MHKDFSKIILTNEQIVQKCKELGKLITNDYKDKSPVIVSLLKGAVPFMAELIKHIDIDDLELDFMDVSSYSGTSSTREVKVLQDLRRSVEGRHVLLVEDIVDTGHTLVKVIELIKDKKAESVKIVSLLNKEDRREVDIHADYLGFEIPNEFVVGFGLDYNEKYRHTSYIGVLKEEIYK